MATFTELLEAIDEAEILETCVASHTGGRYWDEAAIAARPELVVDEDGRERLLEDFGHELPGAVRALGGEDRMATPEFAALVARWARARLAEVKRDLRTLFGDVRALRVSRAMVVTEAWLAELGAGREPVRASRFGFCWSAEDGDAAAHWAEPADGIEIVVEAEIAPGAVDMRATILSRMDYMNGDGEGEIRLRPDAMLETFEIAGAPEAAAAP